MNKLDALTVHQTAIEDVFGATPGNRGYFLRSPDFDRLAAAAAPIRQRA